MVIMSLFLIPSRPRATAAQRPKLDIVGVTLCVAALILFVFALTSGAADGWRSTPVLATLILSVVLMGAFITWESWINEKDAALCVDQSPKRM
jgi:hypothetical protein